MLSVLLDEWVKWRPEDEEVEVELDVELDNGDDVWPSRSSSKLVWMSDAWLTTRTQQGSGSAHVYSAQSNAIHDPGCIVITRVCSVFAKSVWLNTVALYLKVAAALEVGGLFTYDPASSPSRLKLILVSVTWPDPPPSTMAQYTHMAIPILREILSALLQNYIVRDSIPVKLNVILLLPVAPSSRVSSCQVPMKNSSASGFKAQNEQVGPEFHPALLLLRYVGDFPVTESPCVSSIVRLEPAWTLSITENRHTPSQTSRIKPQGTTGRRYCPWR